ncbi:MAG TPA: hypothetical protein VJR29_07470 [bacterium]|nr:hypothetical protein [bacterium]
MKPLSINPAKASIENTNSSPLHLSRKPSTPRSVLLTTANSACFTAMTAALTKSMMDLGMSRLVIWGRITIPAFLGAAAVSGWVNRMELVEGNPRVSDADEMGNQISGAVLGVGAQYFIPRLAQGAAASATALEGMAGLVARTGCIGAAFAGGYALGTGLNYVPLGLGAKRTVGEYLGDAMIAAFGPADRKGTFFKVGEFLGLA